MQTSNQQVFSDTCSAHGSPISTSTAFVQKAAHCISQSVCVLVYVNIKSKTLSIFSQVVQGTQSFQGIMEQNEEVPWTADFLACSTLAIGVTYKKELKLPEAKLWWSEFSDSLRQTFRQPKQNNVHHSIVSITVYSILPARVHRNSSPRQVRCRHRRPVLPTATESLEKSSANYSGLSTGTQWETVVAVQNSCIVIFSTYLRCSSTVSLSALICIIHWQLLSWPLTSSQASSRKRCSSSLETTWKSLWKVCHSEEGISPSFDPQVLLNICKSIIVSICTFIM